MNSKNDDNGMSCSLYLRLGGYDGIAAVVGDFTERLRNDAQLRKFGLGRSTDSRQRIEQLVVQQLCSLTSGPSSYFGRDMKTSHEGLGITEREWDATIELFRAAMAQGGVAEADQQEVLFILDAYKADIVEARG